MRTTISDEELLEQFGKPRSDLIRIMERHTLTVQAWLASRSPQAAIFNGKGVRVSSTGFKVPLLNLALGCDFPAGCNEKDVDEEVKAIVEFFAKRNVPWYWWISTQPSPENIGQIMEKHGITYDSPPLPAMIALLSQHKRSFPKYNENIRVWRAQSAADLRAASIIRRTAFQFPENEAITYFEDMPSDWLDDASPARLFLAGKNKSEPMSIGAVIEGEGIPGVYIMATLPNYHRNGCGKAILTHLLSEAEYAGHSMIALTASKAGRGLYSQFGFIHLFDFDFYSLPSKSTHLSLGG